MRFLNLLLALPLVLAAPREQKGLKDQYIVVLNDDASDSLQSTTMNEVGRLSGVNVLHSHKIGDFKGFTLEAPGLVNSLLRGINNMGAVKYVEPVLEMQSSAIVSQISAPWGLARISSRKNGTRNYIYDNSAGLGVDAYIIDTGIYIGHKDFRGRAKWGANFAGDGNDTDCAGHGTHVAGTVGSVTFGVAKNSSLIAVKVLDCAGRGNSNYVIKGLQWASARAVATGRPSVATMSLGGAYSQAVNDAAAAAVRAGLFIATAAGNEARDSANVSPASEPTVCTVGATDSTDKQAYFSNFGPSVDIFAPGVSILSTYIGSVNAAGAMSGTSMAAPHIGGLAAYILGREKLTPDQLCQRIKDTATKGVVTGLSANTVNAIAYNGWLN